MIIWDFNGTLLPNEPHASEQTLRLYKLRETVETLPFLIRALALIKTKEIAERAQDRADLELLRSGK